MRESNDAKELDELLGSLEPLQSYRTIKFLKQSPYEKTSVVADEQGRQFICKAVCTDAKPHPYELLEKHGCGSAPKIFSCARVGDELVVIMEKLEGMTLAQLVTGSGPVSPQALLTMFKGVFNALSFLHSAYATPVIHRDIKPDNIMITPQGAMLIDFGIARSWDQNASCDTHFMGTSGYAAPEQFGFMQTDARSDIYALGMTLRFALTGAAPGDEAHIEPERLAAAIGKACEFDPKRRYADVEVFEAELERAIAASSKVARQAKAAQGQAAQQAQMGPQSQQRVQQAQRLPKPQAQQRMQPQTANMRAQGSRGNTAARPKRVPPSQRKPTSGWRVLQMLTAAMALYTLWVAVDLQLRGESYGLFTTVVMTFGMCVLPAYYVCDPFDLLRKRGAHDKEPVKMFFILMGIGFGITLLSLSIELYGLHTIAVG